MDFFFLLLIIIGGISFFFVHVANKNNKLVKKKRSCEDRLNDDEIEDREPKVLQIPFPDHTCILYRFEHALNLAPEYAENISKESSCTWFAVQIARHARRAHSRLNIPTIKTKISILAYAPNSGQTWKSEARSVHHATWFILLSP